MFFKVAYCRFRQGGLFKHCCHLFGIQPDTGRRIWDKWARGLGRFFEGQQWPASRQQAQRAMNAKARGMLNVDLKTAAYLGDCKSPCHILHPTPPVSVRVWWCV